MKREHLNPKDLKIYDAKMKVLEEKWEKEIERYWFYDSNLEKELIDEDVRAIIKEMIELRKAYAIDPEDWVKKDVYSIKHGRIIRNKDYY